METEESGDERKGEREERGVGKLGRLTRKNDKKYIKNEVRQQGEEIKSKVER